MKNKFMKINVDIFRELFYDIFDFIGGSLRFLSVLLRIILPYCMWLCGIYLYRFRGKFAIGGEVLIPLIVFLITYYIRKFADHIGKGENVPVPDERFTEKEEDGEYSIERSRLEELILYMAGLEDYLERKGLL